MGIEERAVMTLEVREQDLEWALGQHIGSYLEPLCFMLAVQAWLLVMEVGMFA
jgi:hypothetical protein